MKIALLGLPQSGKKTLFALLTGREIQQPRKPGEAPEARAPIRDTRVDRLAELFRPQSKIYAENLFILCPDMPLGIDSRDWIDTARRCDLLCLVVRDFAADQVYHPAGSVDAARDRTLIESELMLADMARIERRLERLNKEKRAGQTPEQVLEEQTLNRCMKALEQTQWLDTLLLEPHAYATVRSLDLVAFLPRLTALNVDENALAAPPPAGTLKVSARIEQEIMLIDDAAERQAYLESVGLKTSGIERMNQAAYDQLGLMSFYTVGKDEVRAWTIRKGSTAPVAGGKIHSDIERGFIRVEVIKYADLITAGSEQAAKAQGKMQLKGSDYVIEDGDICHFLFNV